MAFLMLLHEKMRLQRKVNLLTFKQLKASSRKERVTKQIERIQKMYSKRESNLQAQAKRMENMASLQIRNAFGLASNMLNTNAMGYLNGGLNNAGIMQTLYQAVESGAAPLSNTFKRDGQDVTVNISKEELYDLLQNGNNNYKQVTKNGATYIALASEDTSAEDWQPNQELQDKYKLAQNLQNMANVQYQQNQSNCTNAISNYQNNISIWLEYEQARLEAEQDEALLPLQEQETEWDMEAQSAETQLADARARLDAIKQALSEGIKDSAPTFGLG